jgi:predicted XRE-type DNA-binding protein
LQKAANLLGLQQPDVSALVNIQTTRFSIERLLRCVRRLDREVSIIVKQSDSAPAAEHAVVET